MLLSYLGLLKQMSVKNGYPRMHIHSLYPAGDWPGSLHQVFTSFKVAAVLAAVSQNQYHVRPLRLFLKRSLWSNPSFFLSHKTIGDGHDPTQFLPDVFPSLCSSVMHQPRPTDSFALRRQDEPHRLERKTVPRVLRIDQHVFFSFSLSLSLSLFFSYLI